MILEQNATTPPPASPLPHPTHNPSAPLPPPNEEPTLPEHKLRYRKLRHRLTLLAQQLHQRALLKEQKDVTSHNKARLLKLSIELEKTVKSQATDYPAVESLLREVLKIVQHRREHDLLILRSARLLHTLSAFLKRFPSLHRSEAVQAHPSLALTLRLLRLMLTLSSNREAFLGDNHSLALSSVLGCVLQREERGAAAGCLSVLCQALAGPHRIELSELLQAQVEYLFCSSLFKRLRSAVENALADDDPANSEFLLLAYKFQYLMTRQAAEKELQRPIYMPKVTESVGKALWSHLQPMLQVLSLSLQELVLERQEGEEARLQQDLPNHKINCLLYVVKTLNLLLHLDLHQAQRLLPPSPIFLLALRHLLDFSKDNLRETAETQSLCSQLVVFLGNLGCQNQSWQNKLRESGLLQSLCNHPVEFLMEPLTHHFLPALSCLLHRNPNNARLAFLDNSAQPLLQYLHKHIAAHSERDTRDMGEGKIGMERQYRHSRKTSVSSVNSCYSQAESFSTQTSHSPFPTVRESSFELKFRQQFWEPLAAELAQYDD